MKILVAGSSPLPDQLTRALTAQHELVQSGLNTQLLFRLTGQQYHLVLIWAKTLPFLRLKKLLQFLYTRFPELNILIAGAEYDSPQRAIILMTGVRDCINCRACPEELLAKISIIADLPLLNKKRFVQQHFAFDFTQNTASYRGVFIPLSRQESLILRCLLRYPGKIISRQTLYDAVWNSPTPPTSNNLDVHISSIRRKIEKPYNLKLIEAVKGRGYRAKTMT